MKRNLIYCLNGRAMKICTDDVIIDELKFLRNLFTADGNPEHFVDKNIKLSRKSQSEFRPTKKNVYISPPFKGDIQAEILTKQLTHAVKNTFNACIVRLHFTTSPLLFLRLKNKVSVSVASFCVDRSWSMLHRRHVQTFILAHSWTPSSMSREWSDQVD